ncbi:hypothetical protein TNIN_65051 [Trichonephila inaurata madagascariensis]|uniref:Uncharacterized protein n=1 Tax=Trichonephila inaurata madagascariensis TaxID=2747483 RepID=A0A8X6WSF4_9ARAC|nr:hypothetical protein TNIN_65051 [Trichonephila inaurata madagascariensis]
MKTYKQDFYTALQEVKKYDRSCKTSLLELKQFCPEKLKVALIVTALSPTQVSVERLFLALKFIKSTVLYQRRSCWNYAVS